MILFLVIGNAFEGKLFGVSAQTWYMVNMGVFGATGAVLGIGARIADERDRGWNRQLRLTPLPPLGYVMGKVLTGMLVALPALALVCLAGALTGEVHLSTLQWAQVIGLGWLAILPMAVVGVGLGYFSSGDNAQAVNGGTIMLMSMFGGIWFPITAASPQWMQTDGARHADVLDHADHPGTADARLAGAGWLAGARRLGRDRRPARRARVPTRRPARCVTDTVRAMARTLRSRSADAADDDQLPDREAAEHVLAGRNTPRWRLAGALWLVFLADAVVQVLTRDQSVFLKVVGLLGIATFCAAYILVPPYLFEQSAA